MSTKLIYAGKETQQKLEANFGKRPPQSHEHQIVVGTEPVVANWAIRESNYWASPLHIDQSFSLTTDVTKRERKSTGFSTREVMRPLLNQIDSMYLNGFENVCTYYVVLDYNFQFIVYKTLHMESFGINATRFKTLTSYATAHKRIIQDIIRPSKS